MNFSPANFISILIICIFALLNFTSQSSSGTKQGPIFVIEPKEKIEFMNTAGGRLDCSTHGNPKPIQYWMSNSGGGNQWTKVDTIAGLLRVLSNGSLILDSFTNHNYRQSIHATDYQCVASNAYGTIKSVIVKVRAVMEQVYQGQVYDEYVIRGNTAVFKCQLPSFVRDDVIVTHWFVDGKALSSEDSKYVMFPSGKLHILKVDDSDNKKKVRCETRHRLSGAMHLSYESGNLHVTDSRSSIQPQKGHHEQVIYAQEGSDIGLPCAAQSFPPPTYTWTKHKSKGTMEIVRAFEPKVIILGGSLLVRDVTEEDASLYQCYVNNTLGYISLKTKLIVSAPLRVHIDNDRQIVDVGDKVILRCAISGYPINNILWTMNGKRIEESKRIRIVHNSLTLEGMERSDVGMYQCFVSNYIETVQATAQLLLGDVRPELVKVFDSITLQPGPTISLECIASGSPTPTFKWFLDDIPIEKNSYKQSLSAGGRVTSNLNISGVTPEDGGTYTCEAENRHGNDEYSANVNIFGVPKIRKMNNVTVASGASALLKCSTYGYPITQITWEKDGRRIESSDRRMAHSNGTLEIREADGSRDGGKYTCVARNRQGQRAKGDRLLIVIDKPVLSDIKFSDGIIEGMRVTVLCTILKGAPPITKSWTKNGERITSDFGIVITHTSTYTILDIESVKRSNAGNYTCKASNSAGITEKRAQLIVQGPPEWYIRPSDTSATNGFDTVLNCQGTGYPRPNVKWTKTGVDEMDLRLNILENGSLVIRNSQKSDSGFYTCYVTNGIEPDLISTIQLIVGVPPRTKAEGTSKMATLGKSVSIKCNIEGDSHISTRWSKHLNKNIYQPFETQDRYKVSRISRNDKSIQLQLVIEETVREDSGLYYCIATNSFGTSNDSLEIIIQERPGKVEEISMLNAQNFTIQLTWRTPNDGNSNIKKYKIFYRPTSSSSDDPESKEHLVKKSRESENKIKIGNFIPGEQYDIWIVAVNDIGWSDNSNYMSFRFAENGTLILSTNRALDGNGATSVPLDLILVLVVPSVLIIVILIIVIVVVYVVLKRSNRRQQQQQHGTSLQEMRRSKPERKSSGEQLYKNVGLMAELRDKQSDLRYGKIQADTTSGKNRYQVLSAPPMSTTLQLPSEADYKRWSTGPSVYAAPSGSDSHYTEVSPYAMSRLATETPQSKPNVVDLKTFALPRYLGETGVTAL